MMRKPLIQQDLSSQSEDDDPTEPRIAAQRALLTPQPRVLDQRYSHDFTVSLDEQGMVTLCVAGQACIRLQADGAFDLFDFLFEHRNLLAARSADRAERECETHRECG